MNMYGIRIEAFWCSKNHGEFLGTKTLGECVSFMQKHTFMKFEKLNVLFVLFRNLEFVLLKAMLAVAHYPLLEKIRQK